MQIHIGRGVRVVPARTRRLGHELVAPAAMRRDRRCALFLHSVYFRGNKQAMPVHVFRNVGVVHNLHGDSLALSHPQKGTGNFIAVADRADYHPRGQLDHCGCDAQGVIGCVPGDPRFRRRRVGMR